MPPCVPPADSAPWLDCPSPLLTALALPVAYVDQPLKQEEPAVLCPYSHLLVEELSELSPVVITQHDPLASKPYCIPGPSTKRVALYTTASPLLDDCLTIAAERWNTRQRRRTSCTWNPPRHLDQVTLPSVKAVPGGSKRMLRAVVRMAFVNRGLIR
jgi:hypothetical protein